MAKEDTLMRLHKSVEAVCPIAGVAIGVFGLSSSVRIDFLPAATAPQRTAAQAVVDAFDWSDAAQAAWMLTQDRSESSALLVVPTGTIPRLLRAEAAVLVDEINALRQWITAFKAAVAGAATFAAMKTAVAALGNMPDRTLAQAKTAIQNKANNSATD